MTWLLWLTAFTLIRVAAASATAARTAQPQPTPSATTTPSWRNCGSGLDEDVLAVAQSKSGDDVYAGGIFVGPRYAASAPLHYVGRFNGSAWEPIGSNPGGLDWFVRALVVVSAAAGGGAELLVAGGDFDAVFGGGSHTLNFVAAFDKGQWRGLGPGATPGVDAPVYALASAGSGSLVYAGGAFTATYDSSAQLNFVAAFDTEGGPESEWRSLGKGLNDAVYALAVSTDGRTLFAGGAFTMESGGAPNSLGRVASWDGTAWRGLGSGLSDVVFALASATISGSDLLIAGGNFVAGGGNSSICVSHIALWNSTSSTHWVGLGRGLDDTVLALTVGSAGDAVILYAGGVFAGEASRRRLRGDTLDSPPALNNVARWRFDAGQQRWEGVGGAEPGLNSPVYALSLRDGSLLAGGDFDAQYGGIANTLNNVGVWRPDPLDPRR